MKERNVPPDFCMQVLRLLERRPNKDKAEKDRRLAVDILRAVVDRGEGNLVRDLFVSLPKGWKAGILKAVKKAETDDLEELLTCRASSQKRQFG